MFSIKSKRKVIVLGALSVGILAACGHSQAFSNYPSYSEDVPAPTRQSRGYAVQEGSLARLTLVDRQSGQTLPIVWHRGRAHVAGQPGRRYALALQNTSNERVLAVAAVDGVNVVTGQTFNDSAAASQSGYVFVPGQRYEVAGWRKSDTQIAAFEFTALSNSYAARTGRPAQVGVISVALFREQPLIDLPQADIAVPRFGRSSRSEAAAAATSPAPAAPSALAEKAQPAAEAKRHTQERESLGTGHGRREYSSVEHTRFARAQSTPNEVLSIYYDSRENLIAQGVLPAPSVSGSYGTFVPRCGERAGETGYVADPPSRSSYCR
jgi:hypothetical protein